MDEQQRTDTVREPDAEKPDGDRPRMDLSSIRDLPPPKPRPQREITVELLPYDQREGVSAHDRLQAEKERRPGAVAKLARTLVGFAIFGALLLGLYFAASALDNAKTPSAAWSKPDAPLVRPSPLTDQ